MALWMLGYPKAALADTEQALADAREIGQAATLMYALDSRSVGSICGEGITTEVRNLADEAYLACRRKRRHVLERRVEC